MTRYTLPLLLFLLPFALFANTIPVTTTADAGAGSLRQALTEAAANGTATADTVIFQLQDQTRQGRTIMLASELPFLSSNLVIDGSTQQGAAFGMSDAKVIIRQDNTIGASGFRFLQVYNAENIEIYGLFLYNTWWNMSASSPNIIGLDFKRVRNLRVGAPGKGNYMRGIRFAFNSQPTIPGDSSAVFIAQSNQVNIDETGGITSSYPYNAVLYGAFYAFRLHNVYNITIGGSAPAEGNTTHAAYNEITSGIAIGNGNIHIENNRFNLTVTGQLDLDGSSGNQNSFTIGGYAPTDFSVRYINNRHNGNLDLLGLSKYFVVKGNHILVPYYISSNGVRLTVLACTAGGIIGGDLTGEPNDFYTNNFSGQNYYAISSSAGRQAVLIEASPGVTISRNSMYNTAYFASTIVTNNSGTPYVRIDSTGVNFVRGKATPNCRIEVFIDDPWVACEGMQLLGTTIAANDSSWQFTGSFDTVVVATATNAAGSTSPFSFPELITNNVVVQHATCGNNNGSITGMKARGYDRVEWRHLWKPMYNQDSVVSNNFDVYNLAPGEYYFHAWLGNSCRSYYARYTVGGVAAVKLDTSLRQVVHPSCGQNTGAIKSIGISNYQYAKWYWKNMSNSIFPAVQSGNTLQLLNAPPGTYKLVIQDTIGGCSDSTNWITLINQSGPTLLTDNVAISHASCGNNNGSVSGIVLQNAVAPVTYRWENNSGAVAGTTASLDNIQAGTYRIKVKDGSACDTIVSVWFVVNNLGAIHIDSSGKQTNTADCVTQNGGITGLQVSGGTSYQWTNASGSIAGTSLLLTNVAAGTYMLTISNSFGCTEHAGFLVPQATFDLISVTTHQLVNATCDLNNGSIGITQFSKNAASYQMHWENGSGNVFNGNAISSLKAGTYRLIAKDTNGCIQQIFTATVNQKGKPVLNTTGMVISNDTCDLGKGAITGLQVSAGSGAPYQWKWYNQSGNFTNNTSLGSGSYHAIVADAAGCEIATPNYTLNNIAVTAIAPLANDLMIQRGTPATITVQNKITNYFYRLFDTLPATTAVQQNNTGVFTSYPVVFDKLFYVQAKTGSCFSTVVPVHVKLFDHTLLQIPNAFSPNGDGVNDTWRITYQGLFTLQQFFIYNRYGQEVYNKRNNEPSWDGNSNGKPAAPGTYYFIIQGRGSFNETIYKQGWVLLMR